MWLLLIVVAVAAGALTTVSGFGGGLLLLLVMSVLVGAKAALAATAVALLVANIHRIWLYRGAVGRRVTVPLLLGLVPGSFAGAIAAAWIPEPVVQAAMIAIVAMSVTRAWLGWDWTLPAGALAGSGLVIGALAGSAGGAGFLIGPIVLAAGLSGRAYLGTVAVSAVAMHVARIAGYGAGGLLTSEILGYAAVLAPALLVGNLVGDRVRGVIPELWQRRIELGMPAVCVALALAGVG
jgi:uncharacterized membrane protein YfcA